MSNATTATTQHVPCGHRWEASRVECETLPVLHVCNEHRDTHTYTAVHGMAIPVHRCACGKVHAPWAERRAALDDDAPGHWHGAVTPWDVSPLRGGGGSTPPG